MTLSLDKQTMDVCNTEQKRIQVESTEILRTRELLVQSESLFPSHLKSDAVHIIKKLTSKLSDIDRQCQKAHETLESETIRCSALRYKFDNMPNAIQTEILHVVMSARMSNKALIDDLQNRLVAMEEEMERLKKEQEITDLHTSVLVPTMKTLQKQYDSAIDYLNGMLTMRAEIQISLNEAKESLEDFNKEISELEVSITQLQDELKNDIEKHRILKENLTSQLFETIEKRNILRKSNAVGERDLYLVKDELRDSEIDLHAEKRKLKKSQDNLSHCRSNLAMLDNESESNSLLLQGYTVKIPEMKAKKAAARKEMNEKSEKYEADISTLCDEIEKVDQNNEQLRTTKKKLEKEVRALERASKSVFNELSVVKDVEKRSKRSLLTEADEATRLRQENMDLEIRYENLQESHSAGIVSLRDKINASKVMLEKRTEERQNIEIHLQTLQTKFQAKKEEETNFCNTCNERMSTAQEDQTNYAQDTIVLQEKISEQTNLLSTLQSELDTDISEFRMMEETDTQAIDVLKSSITDINAELEYIEPDRIEQDNKLNELMEELRTANEQYKLIQDKVIELKTQKSGLNERIQRMTSETKALICMQENFRIEILTKRANTRDLIKEYSKEAIELEKSLWEATNKVRVVEMQNDHFKQTIDKLSRDQSNMLELVSKREEIRSLLMEEMDLCKNKLHIDWREDQELEKTASSRDRKMLVSMSKFSRIAIQRKESLSSVCNRMRDELTLLKTNLENLSSPQDKY